MAFDSLKSAIKKALTPKARRYAYRVVSAVVAYFAIKGIVSGDEQQGLLLVVNAVLGVADAHVDTPESPEVGD